jgi:hypothetical protein
MAANASYSVITYASYVLAVEGGIVFININRAFFLGGRRGTCTPKHFVNLTGESKNFKMLEFP